MACPDSVLAHVVWLQFAQGFWIFRCVQYHFPDHAESSFVLSAPPPFQLPTPQLTLLHLSKPLLLTGMTERFALKLFRDSQHYEQ